MVSEAQYRNALFNVETITIEDDQLLLSSFFTKLTFTRLQG